MAIHVGLDIGAAAVKVAVLRTQYRKLRVEALAVVELNAAPTVEAAIAEALSRALGGKTTGHDGVAVALEGDRVAVRLLTMPQSAQRQLAEALPFELESNLPFDLDEAVWDYRVLGPGRRALTRATDLDILAVIGKVEEVRHRIDLVKAAVSIEPERVGVGALPLVNLLPWLADVSSTEPVCIVDLGTRKSEVLFCVGGELAFSRTVSFGTEGLPETASRLARELRTTIAGYRSQGGVAPSRVILTGGGAFVSGAEAFLAGELAVPVSTAARITTEMSETIAPELLAMLPRFSKALGLALSLGARSEDINLRKGPLAFERGFAWVREKIPMLLALSVVIAFAFILSVFMQLLHLSREKGVLEKSLSTVTGEVLGESTTSADRASQLLAQQAAGADEDPLPHADAFDVMVRMSEAIPQSVVHDIDELDVQKGHVTVRGIVGSVNDAQSIASSLKSEPCFSDVKITRTNQVVGGERQKYEMEFDLKCPEDQKAKKKPDAKAVDPAASASSTGGK